MARILNIETSTDYCSVSITKDGKCEHLRLMQPDGTRKAAHSEMLAVFVKEVLDEAFAQAELVFCLDFNTSSRVMDMQPTLDSSPAKKVLIDHHLAPDIDTLLTVSHPEMSSTSDQRPRRHGAVVYQTTNPVIGAI